MNKTLLFILLNAIICSSIFAKNSLDNDTNLNTESQKSQNPDDQTVTKIIYAIGGPFQNLKQTDEDVSLRTATGKYFRTENGTMQAIIGAGNVHYQENGKWKTILANIFSNTTGRHTDMAFSAPYNQHKIYFPNSPGKSIITEIYGKEFSDWGMPALVWLDKKGKEIAEVQINSGCVGSPDNLELNFKEIFPFVDAKIINSTTSKELKYILTNRAILDNKPSKAVYLAFRENINFDKSWKLSTLSAEKNIAEKLGKEQVAKYYFTQNGKALLEIKAKF